MLRRVLYSIIGLIVCVLGFWRGSEQAPLSTPTLEAPLRLYSNQLMDDLGRLYVDAIERAEESVLLSIYGLSDQGVVGALNAAAERGVAVEILYDPSASWQLKNWIQEGVELQAVEGKGLMHRKILIIDSQELWVGSANMTSESLRTHGNSVLALHAPELAQRVAERLYEPQGDTLRQRIEGQDLEFYLLPENEAALERLVGLIDSAQRAVRVAMFTWTHPRLTEAVVNAQKRGLSVQVVLDRSSSRGASATAVERLLEAGVDVSAHESAGLLHHKLAWIDFDIVALGSANWTRSAFGQNADCLMIVDPISSELQADMDRLWRAIYAESSSMRS